MACDILFMSENGPVKSFRSAKITIAGIECIHMIKKGQIIGSNDNVSIFENFITMMA